MATADEIIVRLTAQTDQLKAGMAEGAAVVKATQDEMAASYANTMNVFQQFDAIQKGSIKTAQDAAAAQDVLTAAEKTGAFTAEELAAKQAILSTAMTKLPQEAEAASSGLAAALTRNSRTAYTTSALISDAMTGQFSRSRREVAALANETGLMSRALRLALSPAGLLAGGIGVLAASTIKAEEDLNDFNDVVERTNGYMGTSAGELQAAAQKIESLGVSYSDAKEAVVDLASSGRFTGEQLLQAATSAAEFAQLTGEKISQVDKLMVEMATNPQKALDELVEKYHRVTPAQAEMIEGLIKQGDKAAATAALVQAMGTSVAASFDKQAKHAGMLDKVLTTLGRDFGGVWRGIGESLNVATGGGDAAEKLTLLQHQLANMRASGETTGGYAVAYQALQKQAAELQTIIDKQHESAAAAKKTADAYAQAHPAQGTFAAFQKNGLDAIDVNGNLTKQLQTAEAAMKKSYGDREQFEEEYWGTILHKAQSGSAAYIQAWQRVQSLQRQLDERQLQESQEAARKQTEASRKAAEEAKQQHQKDAQAALNTLNIKRDASQQYSTQRVQIDAEIVQAAIQWYGRDSSAYRQALRQKQADAEAWQKHETQLALQAASDKRAAILQDVQANDQAARASAQEGEISVQQELAIELSGISQKLAAEISYYRTREQLAGADAKAIEHYEAQITAATKKAWDERKKFSHDAQKEIAKNYVQMMQPVTNAIQQSVNGMIQGTQTARQALANIGQSILGEFISTEAKKLETYIANEMAKTAVTQTGNAARVAADTAGQAESLAVQGASAIKWITTEAAKAAAGAFNAMVSIPYIGPFVAVGASIAAGAAVLALVGRVASAEGGWERVPADGMQTMLHKDEMVLPKHVADPIRNMARGGGNSGGATHVHIHAMDAGSFKSFLKKNPGAMSAALAHAGRNGW